MSTSETSPLLASGDSRDSARILHEVEPTLVADTTGIPIGRGATIRHWVPDPYSADEQGRPRTLVLCFDGTGDQFDDDNSNVIQFLSCLKKDDEKQQLVYYQAGIGTYTNSSFVTPITNQVSKTLDEMIAWNLSAHVQEGYEYLMQTYTYGDKIAIFGFSRGAYTARALAGMIQKVGLLPKYNKVQIPFAWAMYTREDRDGLINSEAFKKTFSTDIVIDFVGVWDTVASVGIVSKELPFVANNSAIRVFRHAISLDEHRAKFMPAFHQATQYAEPLTAKTAGTAPIFDAALPLPASGTSKALTKGNKKAKKMQAHRSESQLWEDSINSSCGGPTDALEVWFAGCHCDVGGGSVPNNTRHSLARIPLRWMIRECFKNETGIIFDKDILKASIGIDADTLYPVVLQRPPRKPPIGMQLKQMEPQGYAITTLLTVMGGLLAIPVNIVLGVIAWPLKHLLLLFKFTRAGKWIRGVFSPRKLSAVSESERATFTRSGGYGALPDVRSPGDTAIPFVSEEDEELADSLMPVYDQLSIRWFWWILEVIPFRFRDQKGKREDFFVRANWGNGRKIYGDAKRSGIKVHRSVKTRLEVVDRGGGSVYQPKAWFKARGASGKKEAGPKNWNVENPDKWKWVD
ncbi:hypothetical protein M0805_003785 [Coniferiporia weirii]|nr:hypothetical protein M0805_003785 [Coniferiporia weirii]